MLSNLKMLNRLNNFKGFRTRSARGPRTTGPATAQRSARSWEARVPEHVPPDMVFAAFVRALTLWRYRVCHGFRLTKRDDYF